MRVTFGRCLLDSETRELLREGEAIHLKPKAFDLLVHLIASRPAVLKKEELQRHLWPKTLVSEASLASLVAQVRAAIGDKTRKAGFIRTVHGVGYAFDAQVAPVARAGQRARLTRSAFRLIWANREIGLSEGENILGRDEDCVAWLDVGSVSRRHARIVVSGEKATIADMGSRNGTFLRGSKIVGEEILSDGDQIRIGTVPLVFRRYRRSQSTEAAESQL